MEDNKNTAGSTGIKRMYEDYFLDYASYVILERAVPALEDGLKPVQRRLLHALKQMDDGRYHKVANVIGQTMQYHPHGDASIGDALVKMGQKDLLIDPQGNWGDARTGDSAAASRYIEARLTKFALEIAFNAQTTEWQLSYDGRNNEPINLPMKFPLVIAQGAEGIAVGLSTKILPHNFQEICRASIQWLRGRQKKIYPDFQSGGFIDVSDYQGGKRGGKVRVRAKIEQHDKKTLVIKELPYGTTTGSLIDSILKANDKGKIKIKKVIDNTAKDVEVLVELAPGVSPTVAIDALYAFTNCEQSISPNACVIEDNKPVFLTVDDILQRSADLTKQLLKWELDLKQDSILEKIFFSSLEKIFIEKRIYRDIEECETWEAVIDVIDKGLQKYVATPSTKKKGDKRLMLHRDITVEDITRLTEIKIKRISKYNSFKADELLARLEDELKDVRHHLDNLTDYAVAYFEMLLEKYGKGRERKTEITEFDTIEIKQVVMNNTKLYVNRKEGFVGNGLKKSDQAVEFIQDCSDIDDVIAVRKDGKFIVTRIDEKTFVGKNIIHAAVWKKGDDRTTYSLVYVDGKTGTSYAKRFQIKSITRDKEYDLTKGSKGSKVLYFAAHPNGEAELISVLLTPGSRARNKSFQFGFEDFGIKGRGAGGNILSKYPVKKITVEEIGQSTFGARELWLDEVSGKLNEEKRGVALGGFDTGDYISVIYKNGEYAIYEMDMNRRFPMKEIEIVEKFDPKKSYALFYYDGNKKWTMLKRCQLEVGKVDEKYSLITDHGSSSFLFATPHEDIAVRYKERRSGKAEEWEIVPSEFIDVKGWKALGNKLTDVKIYGITLSEEPTPKSSKKDDDDDTPQLDIEFEITNL